MSRDSYRQIFRSSAIVGGATLVTVVIGLVRSKVAALLLGPSGIGLVGLLQSLVALGATVAGLGLRASGTRELAAAAGAGQADEVAQVRRALLWGTAILAFVGAGAIWLLRAPLATRLLGRPELANMVGLAGIGVALVIANGSQTALLTGLRRVADLARISIVSAIVSTIVGCALLWRFGTDGVLWFVLSAPASLFVIAHLYIARMGLAPPTAAPRRRMSRHWWQMASVGIPFTASSLAIAGADFGIRALIQRSLGIEPLGMFLAAWTISATYLAFILAGIGNDYYPRLTALVDDAAEARRLLNQQTGVSLLFAAPVLLAVIGLAPWVLRLLFTNAFSDAAELLRWQALGDVAMVVIWPLDYLMLARKRAVLYFLCASLPMASWLVFSALLLPRFEVVAVGMAYALMCAVHVALALALHSRLFGRFAWTRSTTLQFAGVLAGAFAVLTVAAWSAPWGAAAGLIGASVAGVLALRRFSQMVGVDEHSRIGRLSSLARRALGMNA